MTTGNTPQTWQPPKRPAWVEKFNAEGRHLDMRGIVPLDAESLIATAMKNTGLSDFGTDEWHEGLQRMTISLDEDADLNLLGRILGRGDLLRWLEGRLHIEDAYKKYPEIDKEVIGAPLFILGAARTGTTALYNLLSADPDNRTPRLWEIWFPHPAPETATYASDPRIEQADKIALLWDEIMPEFPLQHEQRGFLPAEDNYLMMFSMRAPNGWMGKTKSYVEWLYSDWQEGSNNLRISLTYAKRVMKYLQWKHKCKRWVLKSPALTVPLPLLFEVFPDAMLVHTHRDPVKLMASTKLLMNSVFWIRSDNHLRYHDFYKTITDNDTVAAAMNANVDYIESGAVPKKQMLNVLYQDFIKDNVATVKRIYDYFGLQSSPQSFPALTRYVEADAKARSSKPHSRYEIPEPKEVARLRQLYEKYQSYFGIPNET